MTRVKLTATIVLAARQQHFGEGTPIAHIADDLGVTRQGLWQAIKGETWKDVGGIPEHFDPPADDLATIAEALDHFSGRCRFSEVGKVLTLRRRVLAEKRRLNGMV